MTNEYRGYRIKVTRTDKLLVATIWAPRVLQSLGVKPTATLKEGEAALISRVESAIDKEILKSEANRDSRSAARRR
jgi:hypothetical protein